VVFTYVALTAETMITVRSGNASSRSSHCSFFSLVVPSLIPYSKSTMRTLRPASLLSSRSSMAGQSPSASSSANDTSKNSNPFPIGYGLLNASGNLSRRTRKMWSPSVGLSGSCVSHFGSSTSMSITRLAMKSEAAQNKARSSRATIISATGWRRLPAIIFRNRTCDSSRSPAVRFQPLSRSARARSASSAPSVSGEVMMML
jgi:hypothetical protein